MDSRRQLQTTHPFVRKLLLSTSYDDSTFCKTTSTVEIDDDSPFCQKTSNENSPFHNFTTSTTVELNDDSPFRRTTYNENSPFRKTTSTVELNDD